MFLGYFCELGPPNFQLNHFVDKFANLKNTIRILNPLFLECGLLRFLFLHWNEVFLEMNIIHLGIHSYFADRLNVF